MWDERYGVDDYVYGKVPNEFLRLSASSIPPGRVLCLADGEGRNGVYLASLGFDVTSVDSSRVGIEKVKRLAAEHAVSVTAIAADLADFPIASQSWAGIVAIFCHLPRALRVQVHRAAVAGLVPGGAFVLEAYTPDQLGRGTGGPPVRELLMTMEELETELAGLEWIHKAELVREIHEGSGHRGPGAVVQLLGRKPPA